MLKHGIMLENIDLISAKLCLGALWAISGMPSPLWQIIFTFHDFSPRVGLVLGTENIKGLHRVSAQKAKEILYYFQAINGCKKSPKNLDDEALMIWICAVAALPAIPDFE